MKHQRIVVGRLRAWLVTFDWRKNGDAGVSECKCISLPEGMNRYVQFRRLVQQVDVGLRARVIAHPELSRAEVAQDGGQASHMVGVPMRQRHSVQMANAARPQHLRHYLFPNPPPSISSVCPLGVMSRIESPCPTSMASTSRES